MPEAACITTICRQAVGIPGNDAVAGRESGGSNPSYEFLKEVGIQSVGYKATLTADA